MSDASDTSNGGAFYAPESFRSKFWRKMGFCHHFDEDLFDWRNQDPPQEGFVISAITTNVAIHVSFMDRLRLLVSGRAELSVYTKTNVVVDRAISRSQFAVLPP